METPADPPREPDQPDPQHLMDTTLPGPFASRSEIPDNDRWRLEDIFPDDAAWEAAFAHLPPLLESGGGLGADCWLQPGKSCSCPFWASDLLEQECLELLAYCPDCAVMRTIPCQRIRP